MKKIIVFAILFLMAMPVLAETQRATLINYLGTKVVVEVGSPLAKTLFSNGYVLMGKDIPLTFGARTTTPIWNTADLGVKVTAGSFINASTTIAAVQNPALASSTIDFAIINVTSSATSTYTMQCGTSTNAFINPSTTLINSPSISTSTLYYAVNGVTNSFNSPGATSLIRILVKPLEWVVCKVTTLYSGAFTEATNTFDGKYIFRWFY